MCILKNLKKLQIHILSEKLTVSQVKTSTVRGTIGDTLHFDIRVSVYDRTSQSYLLSTLHANGLQLNKYTHYSDLLLDVRGRVNTACSDKLSQRQKK